MSGGGGGEVQGVMASYKVNPRTLGREGEREREEEREGGGEEPNRHAQDTPRHTNTHLCSQTFSTRAPELFAETT